MAKRQSSARKLIKLVWEHNREATGFSWQRLNSSMHQAVMLAINAGMQFSLNDFSEIYKEMRGHYWFGPDNAHSQGEYFYSTAVKTGNLSACQSFEQWKERPPFIFEGRRLHHGTELQWNNKRCKVTSFAKDGQSLTACSYRLVQDKREYWQKKIEKRFTVTITELRKSEREREKAIAEAKKPKAA